MACAQQLARVGHDVTLYEKEPRIGGLLRFGIPDFKLDQTIIDRRMSQMQADPQFAATVFDRAIENSSSTQKTQRGKAKGQPEPLRAGEELLGGRGAGVSAPRSEGSCSPRSK